MLLSLIVFPIKVLLSHGDSCVTDLPVTDLSFPLDVVLVFCTTDHPLKGSRIRALFHSLLGTAYFMADSIKKETQCMCRFAILKTLTITDIKVVCFRVICQDCPLLA